MKLLKKLLPFVITASLLLSLFTFSASAAGSSIAFSNSKPTVGATVTVTARFSTSSGDPMYGLEAYITYDSTVLQFVSGNNCNKLTDGKLKIVLQSAAQVNLSEAVKFKTLKAGSCAVSVESIIYVDKNDIEQSLSGSSATLTVVDQSATASSNANLKGLGVSAGTLVPAFDPNVTSYNVTIPYDETELWVQPSLADSTASYTVEGDRNMEVGHNRRTIIVTAANGTTKSYAVNITRLDQNGNEPVEETPDEEDNAVEVNVDGQDMYISENFTADVVPDSFDIVDYAFEGKTVPAISDGSYIALYLYTPDGTASSFYVVVGDGFVQLITLDVGGSLFYVLPTDKLPEGYTLAEGYEISGIPMPVYKSSSPDMADFFMIYAKGPGGYTGFYNYDTVDQTLQRVVNVPLQTSEVVKPNNEEEVEGNILNNFNKLDLTGKIVACVILGIILLLIAAVVILIVKIATSGEKKEEKTPDTDADDSVGFEYITSAEGGQPIVPADDIADSFELVDEMPVSSETTQEEIPTEAPEEVPTEKTPEETASEASDTAEEGETEENEPEIDRASVCPSCGTPVTAEDAFCPECGAKTTEAE